MIKFGFLGFIKFFREVFIMLLMWLGFGVGLCWFGMFCVVKFNLVFFLIEIVIIEVVNV